MAKIKTENDLQNFVNDTEEKLDKYSDEIKKIVELEKENSELKASVNSLIEKIKTFTIAQKARGSWKEENTPEAKSYNIGTIVRDMVRAHRGAKNADPAAVRTCHKQLIEKGCAPTRSRPAIDKEGWKEEKVFYGSEEKAGLSSSPLTGDDSVGSYGGSYTVPVIYSSELQRIAMDNSVMYNKVTKIPVTAITTYFPKTTDELAFTKVTNQNTDKTEDTLTFSQLTLTTEIYAAYITIIEEFFEDTLIAVGDLVKTMFGEAWGKKFDDLCLEDSTYGVMSDSSINSFTIGGSSFDDVTVQDLREMIKQLTTQNKRAGGEFFIHATNWDVLEDEVDDIGNYKIRTPQEKAQQRIHGYPVNLVDALTDNSSSAASTAFVAFGNPKYIINGNRVGFEFKIYDQTQSAMESGQIFLRIRTRQAFLAAHPEAWVKGVTSA